MKRLIICVLVTAMMITGTAVSNASKIYDEAIDLLVNGKYARAAEYFDRIASYEDASLLAMYSKAMQYASEERYGDALQAFEFLGDYKDCKYLYIYFKASEIEKEAEDTPELYLDAADLFMSISLFRNSSERADQCMKKLYDRAMQLLNAENYHEASTFFELLGGYADAFEKYRHSRILAAEKWLEYGLFGRVEEELEGLENDEEAAELIRKAEAFLGLKLSSCPVILGLLFNREPILKYTDYTVGEADLETEQCFGMALWIENNNKEAFYYSASVAIDDIDYLSFQGTLQPGESVCHSVDSTDFRTPFKPGEHTCIWYINDSAAQYCYYVVTENRSLIKETDTELLSNLDCQFFPALFSDTEGTLEAFQNTDVISMEHLREGERYVPVLYVANNGETEVSFSLHAILDGEPMSWSETELEAGDYMNLIADKTLNTGEHTFDYYINSCYAGTYQFSVLESSPEKTQTQKK